MYFLECVFMLDHCMCSSVRSNPCRRFLLLGIAHPIEGILFQVQGAIGKATFIRGRFEKKANMWL